MAGVSPLFVRNTWFRNLDIWGNCGISLHSMPAGKYESIWMSEHAQVFYDPRCNSNTFHGFILPWSIKLWQHQHALRGRFLWSHCFLQSLALARQPLFVAAAAGQTGIFWGRDRRRDGKNLRPKNLFGNTWVSESDIWHILPLWQFYQEKHRYLFGDLTVFGDEQSGDCFGKNLSNLKHVFKFICIPYVFLVYSLCSRMYDMRICMCIYIISIFIYYIYNINNI